MLVSSETPKHNHISAAEAFYRVFLALPKPDRLTIARYILDDEDIRQQFEIPNKATLKAFSEDESEMPLFDSIDDLRKDLLS